MEDPLLGAAVEELVRRHGCHTVILYGSRAKGTETDTSDYDLMGFRSDGPQFRDARFFSGVYLDAFIYPESAAEAGPDFLHVRGGRVMCQQDGLGDKFLAGLEPLYQAGPSVWPADECAAARAWADKMLARMARGDVEAHYRRAWLLMDLLQDYFRGRGLWYEGPKASFAWLKVHDAASYAAFERALEPGASMEAIEALVRRVWPQ